MNYYGDVTPVEMSKAPLWDPRSGWATVRRWRAPKGTLAGMLNEAKAAGKRAGIDPDGEAFEILTVVDTTPDGSVPTELLADNWALLGNSLQKSVWQCPLIARELEKIESGRVRGEIRTKLSLLARGDTQFNRSDGTAEDLDEKKTLDWIAEQGVSREIFAQLLKDMGSGVDSYQVAQYVLKHQFAFIAGQIIKDPYVMANKLMTTATLKVREGFPVNLPFDLPAGVWLKQTPSVQPLGSAKYQIEEEWWHADDYARSLYTLEN